MKNDTESETENEFEVVASELDEATHAEMLMMYNEAALSIRFQKHSQWRALFLGIFLQIVILAFGEYSPYKMYGLAPTLIITSTITTAVFIYVIFVYHILQGHERAKIKLISKHMSNLLQEVRHETSKVEAVFHRYTLMATMAAILIAMSALVISLLSRFNY